MKDIIFWGLLAVAAVDVLFYWYSRMWLVLLNALAALGLTVFAFLDDVDPKVCLLGVLVTLAAGQSLYITEHGDYADEDAFNIEDYVDAPRPGGDES